MSNTVIGPPRATGIEPLSIGRNGHQVDAMRLRTLARYVNTIGGTRFKTVGRIHVPAASTLDTTTDTCTWRWVNRTSVNARSLRYEVVCAPCASTDAAITPRLYWVVNTLDTSTQPAGVSATAQTSAVTVTARDTGTIVPDDLVRVSGQITVTGNAVYALELHVVDRCRPVSCALFEETHEGRSMSVSDYMLASPDGFNVGAGIFDRDIGRLLTAWNTIYSTGGAQHFGWTSHSGTPRTNTSLATKLNLLDDASTAYGSNAPGFWVSSLNRGTYTADSITPTFYAYASMSAGTTGSVTFDDSTGTAATIASIGTSAGYYTVAGRIADDADYKIDPFILSGHGTNTLSVYAVGCYD